MKVLSSALLGFLLPSLTVEVDILVTSLEEDEETKDFAAY